MQRILYILLLLFTVARAAAQETAINDAISFLQAGNADKARELIDKAIAHEATADSPKAWYLRGFIYKELFKKDSTDRRFALRDTSRAAFNKSITLDSGKELLTDNTGNLNYLAATYYNDAVQYLSIREIETSAGFYESYITIKQAIDSTKNYTAKVIEYNLNLGLVYMKLATQDSLNSKQHAEKARKCYQNVLELDSDNFSANYRMGILYYNQAVDIIRDLDYEIEFYILDNKQDTCIVLAKNSLPYMLRAYKLDSQKEDPIKGLMGIYYLLNEKDKYNEFLNKLDELKSDDKE